MNSSALPNRDPTPSHEIKSVLTIMTAQPDPHLHWIAQAEIVGKDGLMRFVLDATRLIDWAHKDEDFAIPQHGRFPSFCLMALEVFCYARGIYDSMEVSVASRTNPELKPLFQSGTPDDQIIKRFRRLHHDAIKLCLLQIFDLAFRVRFGDTTGEEAPVDYCVVRAMDQWFEPICGPRPGEEASMRIDQAVFADNVLGFC